MTEVLPPANFKFAIVATLVDGAHEDPINWRPQSRVVATENFTAACFSLARPRRLTGIDRGAATTLRDVPESTFNLEVTWQFAAYQPL